MHTLFFRSFELQAGNAGPGDMCQYILHLQTKMLVDTHTDQQIADADIDNLVLYPFYTYERYAYFAPYQTS